jgi:ferritin-like metal-binding protein YciE
MQEEIAGKKCKAMAGLLKEGEEAVEADGDPMISDSRRSGYR